eukprot:IDg14043t1
MRRGSWMCRSCIGFAQSTERDLVISLELGALVRIKTEIQAFEYILAHRRALNLLNSIYTNRIGVALAFPGYTRKILCSAAYPRALAPTNERHK